MQNSSKAPESFFAKHIIGIIMWGLLAIIFILLFSDFSKAPTIVSEKIDPYVLSTKGKTLIIREKLITVEENKQEPLFVGDKVKTLASTATVFWPDGSITRLGENSAITINEMRAETANTNIQIDFSLETGKSWSNVVKYMFGESYFRERFNNDTALAAVRGTVFEVNMDRKYIHTIDHAVTIEDMGTHTGSTFVVAGGILDTNTRKVLAQDVLDQAWNAINSNADLVYINEKMELLKKAIFETLGKKDYFDLLLEKLGLKEEEPSLEVLLTGDEAGWVKFETEVTKGKSNQELLDIYQQFYGLSNTETLLETKMKLRDLIIKSAPTDKQQMFLDDFARSTLYDSWNALSTTNTGSLDVLQKKLEQYIKQGASKDLINTLNDASTLENIQSLNNNLENFKNRLIETLGKKDLFEETVKEVGKNINLENIEKINNAADKIQDGVTEGLKDGLKNLIQ